LIDNDHSYGIFSEKNHNDPKFDNLKYFSNPLGIFPLIKESKLPNAPNMKLHCLYGIGKPSEISYVLKKSEEKNINYQIDLDENGNNTINGLTEGGILNFYFKDGDGTVPLLSLGFMCSNAWKNQIYNPFNVKIHHKEYKHLPSSIIEDLRGGISSSVYKF
jgi:phospholipid:diacylglycerol acyltransferase